MHPIHFKIIIWKHFLEYFGCFPSSDLEFQFANCDSPLLLHSSTPLLIDWSNRFNLDILPVSLLGLETNYSCYHVPVIKLSFYVKQIIYSVPVYYPISYHRQYIQYHPRLLNNNISLKPEMVLPALHVICLASEENMQHIKQLDPEKRVLEPVYRILHATASKIISTAKWINNNTGKQTAFLLKSLASVLNYTAILIEPK